MNAEEERILHQDQERREWIDREFVKNFERGANAAALQEDLDGLRVAVWSRNHEVRVTVGSTGLLVNVEYGQRGLGLSGSALASLTLMTLRQALAQLQEKVEEVAVSHGDASVGRSVASSYREAFAEQVSHLDDEGTINYR